MSAFRVPNNREHQSPQITVVTKIYTWITRVHTLRRKLKSTNNCVHQDPHMTKNTKAYSPRNLTHDDVHQSLHRVHLSPQITVVTKLYTWITKLHTLRRTLKSTKYYVHQSPHLTMNTKAYSSRNIDHDDVH